MNFCKPRGPQHTYYYLVVIIVARKKMQEHEMKYTFKQQKLPSKESHNKVDSNREFIRLENYAFIHSRRNFCEMIINDNKAIPENLVVVR